MTPSSDPKPPAAHVFDLLTGQAPTVAGEYWRFATAAVAQYLPQDAAARPRYFDDMRVVLLMVFCAKYDMPADTVVTRQVDEALAVVESYSVRYWH